MNKNKSLIIVSTLFVLLCAGCAHIPQTTQVNDAKTTLQGITQALGKYYTKNKNFPEQENLADRFAAIGMQDPSNESWQYRFFCNNHALACFATARNVEKGKSTDKQISLRTSIEKNKPQKYVFVQLQQDKSAKTKGDMNLSVEKRTQAKKSACEKIGARYDEKMGCVLE